jgi:hypothetical protein
MTHRINGRFVLAVAALALATTGLTTAAHADVIPVLSDIATLSGCANTSPAVPAIPDLGGGGSFTKGACGGVFALVPDVCLVAYSDPDTVGTLEGPESCNLGFFGTYTNTLCGTGMAHGQATIGSAHESEVVTFDIAFVAGVGVFTGTSPSDGDPGDRWAGVVDILPSIGDCVSSPVAQFRFTAAVVGVDA